MQLISFIDLAKNHILKANSGWFIYLMVVILLCSLDVMSGVFNAFMKHNLQSKEFKKGAIGKTAILCVVCLAIILDYIFNLNYLFNSTCIFYILEESLSILENLKDYIKIPEFITNRIKDIKNNGGV